LLRPLKHAFFAVLMTAACDEKKDEIPNVPPAPASSIANELGFDASAFATDPPAPAGDLKGDLDRFVNVDTCVTERAKLDPLVGDALGAIGYDTFLRDACRMLEAAKDKKKEACERIDSSPLRRKCQSWVAILAQAPDQCPLPYEAVVTRGRTASCVAIAARDPRLCAGEARSQPRATCEAMVNNDPRKCSVLLPAQKASCEREVTRWKSLLSPPLEGLEKLPTPSAKLRLNGGSDAGAGSDIDLTSDIASGVVVVTAGKERSRVEVGALGESELTHLAAAPMRAAHMSLSLMNDPKPAIEKIELIVPNEAPYVSPPATCDCKLSNVKLAATRGSAATFSVEGKIVSGTRVQVFSLDVTTFVRDVVPDREGGGLRTIAPIHPLGLPGRPDGGARR
jgi:hypothetical protein